MRDGRKVFLLHGLGGIGKTQLAVKFARDFHSRYSAVFWLDGSTKSNLKDSFSRMLRRMPDYSSSPMGESIGNEQDKEIDAIQHWLSMPGNKHWLIIIDNVDYDQSNPKDSKSYDLDEYLPRAEHGSILITSRFRSVGQRFEDLQVDSVTDQEACAILNANARSPTPRDSNYWRPLINRLEGLPLALALAGSYIGQLGMSVNDYLDLYNSSWPELVNEHEPRQDYKGRTLLTTWQISVERAKGKDHVVEDLLKVWAVLDRNDIWSQLFAFKPSSKSSLGSKYPSSLKELRMNPLVFQRAMKVLLDLSLIVRSEDESSFSMHPVVHAWCKSLISNQEEPDIYRIAATIIYMHDQCEDLAQKLRIRRHALPVAEYYSKSPRSPRKYLLSLGRFLAGYQDFGLATPMITMAAKKYEGKQDFDKVLQCYEVLHESYGKLTMAEKRNEVYQKACQTYKTIRAQNSGQSTIRAHIRMGQIHNNRTNLKEAAKAYQRAIKECKANGENSYSRERLAATCCLAMIYRGERKYGQAERLLVPALDFAQTTLSESNTRTKTIRSLLSATYISMGNIDAAKAIFEKILKETPDDMSFIDRCFLGSLYLKTGLLNEARSLLESSHEKWTSSFIRPNEVSYGSALQLSHLYCATGNPTKAIKILRSVLEIDEQRLPSLRTMETATATLRLAIALSRQGESSQDVANLFDWAIEALGSLERPCYRPVLVMSTRFELFRWQMCENRIQDAEKTLETLFHKYFQPLNRDVLVLYLACIVADLGNKMQFGTAEKLQELVVQNLAKVYGPKSRMLLDANKNLEQVKSWGQNWTSGKEFRCGIVRYSCHHIGLQETTSERVGSLRECRQEDVERPYKGWRQVVAALALILYACGFTAVVSAIPFLDARIPERAYLWLAVNYGDLSMSFAQTLFQLSEERCPSHDTEPWLGEPVSGRHAWSIGERGNRAVSHQKS
ncbi:uncharacterized protein J3D65DRAFT_73498 [Phyllosticta citribraziliensis]|uniref:NB-ARC domain-containing protein n=1 Tax=Phyllosticta citribraziliensis TaxID=989973 RepID=A0ABR1LD78_9PEZI